MSSRDLTSLFDIDLSCRPDQDMSDRDCLWVHVQVSASPAQPAASGGGGLSVTVPPLPGGAIATPTKLPASASSVGGNCAGGNGQGNGNGIRHVGFPTAGTCTPAQNGGGAGKYTYT